MLASHNGYQSESATSRTASVFIPSCNSSRSRSEYGTSSRRPSEPVATMAKPLPGMMPISEAFVVSQNSWSSPHASRSAAESSSFGPRASSFSRAAAKSLAAPESFSVTACSRPDRMTPARAASFPSWSVRLLRRNRHAAVLDRVGPALAGAHPHHRLHRADPDLAIADLAGARGPHDAVERLVGVVVLDQHLDPDLGHEVDGVLGATVDLGVPLLTSVPLNFADRHAQDAHLLEAGLDVFERERL